MSSNFNAYRKALYEVVTPVLGGLVVVLNSAELYLLLKAPKRTRRTMGNIYIVNLCISDIFVGCVMIILKSMTPFINTTLKGNEIAEHFYDVIHYLFIRLSLFVSVINLIALTLDRLWAITKPFSHNQKTRAFAIKVCIGVWVLSTALSATVYCVSRYGLGDVERYNTLIFPIATYVGTCIFVICYTKIYLTLRTSRLKMGHSRSVRRKTSDKIGLKGQLQEEDELTAEMKVLKLAVKTVGLFVLCWTPFSTASLLRALGKSFGGKSLYSTFFTLAFFNSVLNPFVYFQHVWRVVQKKYTRYRKRRASRANSTFDITDWQNMTSTASAVTTTTRDM